MIDNGGDFDITLTINTDSYTGSRSGFNQVEFKAISDWTSVALTSDPGGTWAAPIEANVSSSAAGPCTGGGSSDKICTSGFVDVTSGGDYTWTYNIVGGTLLDVTSWHIGAQYADGEGRTTGQIISTDLSGGGDGMIPEPSAGLLFAMGSLMVAGRLRR